MFSSIHNNYLCTCISGINHTTDIIMGRPQGGVAILYKKSLSGIIKHITITNRRLCGINITVNNSSLVILSIYMPCDNYSRTIVNQTFSDCIDDIECILSDLQCTSFIGAGDYNTCFNRLNAQTTYLTDFIRRNNLSVSWDHQVSNKDNTYNNFSLNHFSSIDHFIITHTIYDSIISNNVINEVTNPSNHNAILLSFSLNINLAPKVNDNRDLFNCNPLWKRASNNDVQEYTYPFDKCLSEIHISPDLLLCTDCKCLDYNHKHYIDLLCWSIIMSGLKASSECIPITRSRKREVAGWTDHVKPERDRSGFFGIGCG